MADLSELYAVKEAVVAYRKETIGIMNDPEHFLRRQRERVENARNSYKRELTHLLDMKKRVDGGAETIEHCDKRLAQLRDQIIMATRKATIERLMKLAGLMREMQQDIGNPDLVDEEMIIG